MLTTRCHNFGVTQPLNRRDCGHTQCFLRYYRPLKGSNTLLLLNITDPPDGLPARVNFLSFLVVLHHGDWRLCGIYNDFYDVSWMIDDPNPWNAREVISFSDFV